MKMLQILQIYFVIKIINIVYIKRNIFVQICNRILFFHMLFIVKNDVKKNRIIVAYNFNINEKFAIV